MSAFIVSKAHIDALVAAGRALHGQGYTLRWRVGTPDLAHGMSLASYRAAVVAVTRELTYDQAEADQVGAMLWNENRRSVDHRYSEATDREVYRFPVATRTRPAVEILKALACYEYQSCEHPEWETSEARAYCEALRWAMIDALPGYEQAPWEISA